MLINSLIFCCFFVFASMHQILADFEIDGNEMMENPDQDLLGLEPMDDFEEGELDQDFEAEDLDEYDLSDDEDVNQNLRKGKTSTAKAKYADNGYSWNYITTPKSKYCKMSLYNRLKRLEYYTMSTFIADEISKYFTRGNLNLPAKTTFTVVYPNMVQERYYSIGVFRWMERYNESYTGEKLRCISKGLIPETPKGLPKVLDGYADIPKSAYGRYIFRPTDAYCKKPKKNRYLFDRRADSYTSYLRCLYSKLDKIRQEFVKEYPNQPVPRNEEIYVKNSTKWQEECISWVKKNVRKCNCRDPEYASMRFFNFSEEIRCMVPQNYKAGCIAIYY